VTDWGINAGMITPQQLVGVAGTSEGLAQKNTGDLLVVDRANNQVRRAPASVSANTTQFISSGLFQPFGIARRSDGDLFVSNQGQGHHNVMHFDPHGANPAACQSLSNDTPNFMQMSLDRTLYIGVTGAGGQLGSVRAVNAKTCQQTQSFAIPFPAVGIALSNNMTASQTITASNGNAVVNFGFAAFELNQIVGNCSGSIGIGLASPAALDTLINLSGVPADPAVNLALDGFEAVFSTANMSSCQAADAVTNNFQMSNFMAQTITNPEIVVCDDANTTCTPGKGNPTFVTIGLVSNGSSGLAQPLFKADSNAQYLLNWDTSSCIMPSGVTQVCPSGTYSLTVLLLTNNTTQQSIYDTQTTLVVLK
jgi:hypothetical protein